MGVELGLRVLSLVVLAAAVWIAWRPPGQSVAETVPNGDLPDALARWTIPRPNVPSLLNGMKRNVVTGIRTTPSDK